MVFAESKKETIRDNISFERCKVTKLSEEKRRLISKLCQDEVIFEQDGASSNYFCTFPDNKKHRTIIFFVKQMNDTEVSLSLGRNKA